MDNKIIFSMSRVGKVYRTKHILRDISLSFFYGAKIGVLGSNGAGKSSLLKIIAGVDDNYIGEISRSKGYSIGFLSQEPEMDEDKTIKEVVEEGVAETVKLLKDYEAISAKFSEVDPDQMDALIEEQGKIQEKIDACDGWDLDARLDLAMNSLMCPPKETKIKVLSGGERRRVALCRLLLRTPDILLLDEPTNHLDAETVYWLEQHLKDYKGTVIAVTHDRYFLDNVAGWILELDRGHGIPYQGNYSSWLEQKLERLRKEEKAESKRQKALDKELEWIRSSPKARQAKNKARIGQYYKNLEEVKDKANDTTEIFIPSGPRLGKTVIEANGLKKSYGDHLLYEDLKFTVPAGAIVGIIGPNGVGKSTLFRMLIGNESPDSGDIKLGETVKLAYVDQSREMDPEKTIFDVISGGNDTIEVGKQLVNVRAYIAKFNFSGEVQSKKVGMLSGGERNRVHLACMLKEGGNVLLLDEPTNDLDVHTLRALEEAISSYPGCAMIISHDRYFLDRVATHILSFDEEDQIVWFEGSCSEYEADKRKRLGTENQFKKRRHCKMFR